MGSSPGRQGRLLCSGRQVEATGTMSRHEYRVRHWSSTLAQELADEYSLLVRRIRRRSGDDDLRRALLSGFAEIDSEESLSRIFSRLQVAIKSHKPWGKVTLRPIHSSVGSPLLPAYLWVAKMLRPHLASLPHLLKDSYEACSRIRNLRLPKNVRFYKADVADFFLVRRAFHSGVALQ